MQRRDVKQASLGGMAKTSSRSAKNGLGGVWLDGWHGESMENDGLLEMALWRRKSGPSGPRPRLMAARNVAAASPPPKARESVIQR